MTRQTGTDSAPMADAFPGAVPRTSPEAPPDPASGPAPVVEAVAALDGLDPAAALALLAARTDPPAPYERIAISPHPEAVYARRMEAALARGAIERHGVEMPLDGSADWSGAGLGRSRKFYLQAWDPLDGLFLGHDVTGSAAAFDRLAATVVSWARWLRDGGACVSDGGQDFAWYDMAVGLRVYRLAYFLDHAARRGALGALGAEDADALIAALRAHVAYLSDDANIVFHNNHGLYQAAGQVAAGRRLAALPGMAAFAEQGRARLARMILEQFSPAGVHLEHSPGYHVMVARTLAGLVAAGLVEGEARDRAARAGALLEWFMDPGGGLANFGDTDRFSREQPERPAVLPPISVEDCRGGLMEAGYVLSRSGEGETASYFAQMAAFHSRTHKHADDGGFIWFDGGEAVLVDGGRYGYPGKTALDSRLRRTGHWYDDPVRIHLERSRAHNTVEVDGRDLSRMRSAVYGSGLVRAEQRGAVTATECAIPSLKPIRHARVVAFRPGAWLVCLDSLIDPRGAPHAFRQWFNLAPVWTERRFGEDGAAFGTAGGRALSVVQLAPGARFERSGRGWRGPDEPDAPTDMVGWRSERDGVVEPVPCFSVLAEGAPSAFIATLFAFGPVEPDLAAFRVNVTGRQAQMRWRGPEGVTRLAMDRMGEAPLVTVSVQPASSAS